jgi:hypothetical protein
MSEPVQRNLRRMVISVARNAVSCMRRFGIALLLASITLFAASNAMCGSISACGGKYEIPVFAEANTKLFSEPKACAAVVYDERGTGSDKYLHYIYGFMSYKEKISAKDMRKFQLFVARFVNRIAGHDVGEFSEEDPVLSAQKGEREIYLFKRKYTQQYKGEHFSGVHEIITKVDGGVTNSYFIVYSKEGEAPAFYEKFKEWAMK